MDVNDSGVSRWTYLRSDDFATKLTTAGSLPRYWWTADQITVSLLAERRLLVDTEAGVVVRQTGVRAETPLPNGYGSVYLGRIDGKVRWARAHRVVWIAAHGEIPGLYVVNHRNGRRWDNRIANLDMTTRGGNARHAAQLPYEHVAGVAFLGEDDRPQINPIATAVGRSPVPRHSRSRVMA